MYRWVIWAIPVTFGGLMCTLSVLAFKKSITREDVLASSCYTKSTAPVHPSVPAVHCANKQMENQTACEEAPSRVLPKLHVQNSRRVPRSF